MQLSSERSDYLREFLDRRLSEKRAALRLSASAEDPIGTIYRYSRAEDLEIAALIASSLAYGQRKVFVPIVKGIFDVMGASPYDFVRSADVRRYFDGLIYRFNSSDDIRCLVHASRHLVETYGSLESAFVIERRQDDTLYETLCSFVSLLRGLDFSPLGLPVEGSPSFSYLIPDPRKKGACKRLNMFLRWMVRKDDVDLGIWSGVSRSELIIPLDTHVQKASSVLGLTSRPGNSWAVAEDITASLRCLDPSDPLKYDFLLFSLGAWKEL
jgi:uncharacterized protein (TIGR02757 family)